MADYTEWTSPENSPIENALLIAAHLCDKEKVREQGHNAGFWVSKFLASVGLPTGYAWCAAFASYCLKEAGYKGGPKSGKAAVRNWAAWAMDTHRIVEHPQRGDLFYWLNSDGTGHIGFVVRNRGQFVDTISGNTNEAGSREGDGIYRKAISIGPRMRFIRL